MAALDDLGLPVVFSDLPDDVLRAAVRLRDEDDVRAGDVARRFAQHATRQHVAVPEGVRLVDEHDLVRVFEALVLEAVVEDERVASEARDRVASRLHAVAAAVSMTSVYPQ